MIRGELWWAEEPEWGRRPVLILTRDVAVAALHRLVVVPATKRIRGIPSEVVLDENDGLPAVCALTFDNLASVPKSLLTERICRLRGDRMAEVCAALAYATDCD